MRGAVFFLLALKYLLRYRRRYLFLFFALSFGFGIVTFITSVRDGMDFNLHGSAQSHYAGDIVATGYEKGLSHHLGTGEIAGILEAVKAAGLRPARQVLRTHWGNKGTLYYNGVSLNLKYIIGVDWDTEEAYFQGLKYREKREVLDGRDMILISHPIADFLGARLGDRVLLEVLTRHGEKNTAHFIVGGIVEDSGIFGFFKAYTSRETLNRLILYGEDEGSSVGLFFHDPGDSGDSGNMEKKRRLLWNELSKSFQTAPLVKTREEFSREEGMDWEGIKIFLITLPVYLSEIADILGALRLITYFLYGMMLLIILVSAAVTYNLILHERVRELGVMGVIGFQGADLGIVLFLETLGLALFSILAGFVFSLVLSRSLSLVSFQWFPGFEIFLKDGRLDSLYLPQTLGINTGSVLAVLLAALLPAAFRLSRYPLPFMLNGGKG